MNNKIIQYASDFFKLDQERLSRLCTEEDLYEAIAELTDFTREEVKNYMYGFMYSADRDFFKRKYAKTDIKEIEEKIVALEMRRTKKND